MRLTLKWNNARIFQLTVMVDGNQAMIRVLKGILELYVNSVTSTIYEEVELILSVQYISVGHAMK